MVSVYWQQHEAFRAAVQAAREALDAADRAEEAYYAAASFPHDPKPYVMESRAKASRIHAHRIMNELDEAIGHVRDAVRAWWPEETAGADCD